MYKSAMMMGAMAIQALNSSVLAATDGMASLVDSVKPARNPGYSRLKYVGWNPNRGRTYFRNAENERSKARNLALLEKSPNAFMPIKVTPRPEGSFAWVRR